MEALTLTTFSLTLPDMRQTVELLGSWDNFAHPYRMQRDTARGKGVWVGCHTFDHIVFDGTALDWSKPRSGPLKQGGQYWYFYRLDDVEEYCDPSQPSARDCPLLPGQALNHLEIPLESQLSQLSNISHTMTYDPQDRYNNTQTSKLSSTAASHRPPTRTSSYSASPKGYFTPPQNHLPANSSSPTLGSEHSPRTALERKSPNPTGWTLRTKISRLFKQRTKTQSEPQRPSPDHLDFDMSSPTFTAYTIDTPSLVTPPIDTPSLPAGLFPIEVYKSLCAAIDRQPKSTDQTTSSGQHRLDRLTTARDDATTSHLPDKEESLFKDLDFLGEAIN